MAQGGNRRGHGVKRLAIVGIGLMGGALGMAVRQRRLPWTIAACARRPGTRELALRLNAADEVFAAPEQAVHDADLVVFCLPVLAIPVAASQCRGAFKSGAVVTDVASTKAELVTTLDSAFRGLPVNYAGSHPICGSEQTGLEAARPDLYEDAMVVVTPGRTSSSAAIECVTAFWRSLGARISVMEPLRHDRIIARTSHLPHLVAAMLVDSLHAAEGDLAADFCGRGFRDTTRIAAGSEEIWHDIVKTNRAPVGEALVDFEKALRRVKDLVQRGEFDKLREVLAEARARRTAIGLRLKGNAS